ncbi:MAG: Na+/H+ antiporter NhaA [Bacteroides sp.]|nr:Na+/H+ antiporter NhaA [Bacteroides sp.]MCM1447257.1 Na+/H+ antiporter NhaA [Bacteroides sp.]
MKQNYTFMSTIRRYAEGGNFLILSTIIALVVANLPATAQWYDDFWQKPLSLIVGGLDLFSHNGSPLTMGGFISDFLMAIFFLSVGLELKREIFCGGELSTPRKAMLPVLAAIGGMIVPTIVFGIACRLTGDMQYMTVMERGMPIPMATDIAFSLGVLSLFSKRVPIGLKVFLAALAVADDLGGILVIAIKYTDHISLAHLGGVLGCVCVCLLCSYFRVRNKMVYLSMGMVMWWCMLQSGIHSTIAGVVLAFCIPARLTHGSKYYIERIRAQIDKFPHYEVTAYHKHTPNMLSDEDIQNLRSIETASDHLISTLQDTEDVLRNPVNMFIIPVFAFANAGICFDGMSLTNLFSGVGLGVFMGLVLGKFSGVMLACWLSIKTRLVQLPDGANWPSMAGVAMLCGIGFTVSMFMSALSYPHDFPGQTPELMNALLNDAKLGILCGTITSAVLGSIVLNKTLPRRSR